LAFKPVIVAPVSIAIVPLVDIIEYVDKVILAEDLIYNVTPLGTVILPDRV